jgi:HAD superfamily hydrolase (TIGR01484 family)
MRYLALATDYDGTLATHGIVHDTTNSALGRLRASGRRLLMVTGRELPELRSVYSRLDLFDLVVAENGALLYMPSTGTERLLAEPYSEAFVQALRARGVPFTVGRSIVATVTPHEDAVLHAIEGLGLELQVIFNKGSVMVLPTGVNKSSGLLEALRELGISPRDMVGIGDAENDHAFLSACGVGVAVANALPALKERADYVTGSSHGAGVVELIEMLLADDLASLPSRHTAPA